MEFIYYVHSNYIKIILNLCHDLPATVMAYLSWDRFLALQCILLNHINLSQTIPQKQICVSFLLKAPEDINSCAHIALNLCNQL